MAELSDDALLLRRIPYSDTSLICHFFTRQHGRITLMARGARRAKSPFRAALAPLYDLQIRWRPGRTGMGSLSDISRGTKLLNDRFDLEGLELCSVASRLFREGDPHGYGELHRAVSMLQHVDPRTALLMAIWQLLHEGGWVGDLDYCWQCGCKTNDDEAMVWQGSELLCVGCGRGMTVSAGMRKGLIAQFGSSNVRLDQSELSSWQRMIQDVLREHGISDKSLFQERS